MIEVKSISRDKKSRLKPISLYPLKPEEALSAFMRIDPRKIKNSRNKGKRRNFNG